jgi:hypothetical protein
MEEKMRSHADPCATVRTSDIEGDPATVAAILTYIRQMARQDPTRALTVGQVDAFYHLAVEVGQEPDAVRAAIGLPPIPTRQLMPYEERAGEMTMKRIRIIDEAVLEERLVRTPELLTDQMFGWLSGVREIERAHGEIEALTDDDARMAWYERTGYFDLQEDYALRILRGVFGYLIDGDDEEGR